MDTQIKEIILGFHFWFYFMRHSTYAHFIRFNFITCHEWKIAFSMHLITSLMKTYGKTSKYTQNVTSSKSKRIDLNVANKFYAKIIEFMVQKHIFRMNINLCQRNLQLHYFTHIYIGWFAFFFYTYLPFDGSGNPSKFQANCGGGFPVAEPTKTVNLR